MGVGFNGRVFLEPYELETYKRRMPVRFVRRNHAEVCHVCGKPGTSTNPLQHSHLIPFTVGVLKFGLTPDFLDSDSNIVSAHRALCNKSAELSESDIVKKIEELLTLAK